MEKINLDNSNSNSLAFYETQNTKNDISKIYSKITLASSEIVSTNTKLGTLDTQVSSLNIETENTKTDIGKINNKILLIEESIANIPKDDESAHAAGLKLLEDQLTITQEEYHSVTETTNMYNYKSTQSKDGILNLPIHYFRECQAAGPARKLPATITFVSFSDMETDEIEVAVTTGGDNTFEDNNKIFTFQITHVGTICTMNFDYLINRRFNDFVIQAVYIKIKSASKKNVHVTKIKYNFKNTLKMVQELSLAQNFGATKSINLTSDAAINSALGFIPPEKSLCAFLCEGNYKTKKVIARDFIDDSLLTDRVFYNYTPTNANEKKIEFNFDEEYFSRDITFGKGGNAVKTLSGSNPLYIYVFYIDKEGAIRYKVYSYKTKKFFDGVLLKADRPYTAISYACISSPANKYCNYIVASKGSADKDSNFYTGDELEIICFNNLFFNISHPDYYILKIKKADGSAPLLLEKAYVLNIRAASSAVNRLAFVVNYLVNGYLYSRLFICYPIDETNPLPVIFKECVNLIDTYFEPNFYNDGVDLEVFTMSYIDSNMRRYPGCTGTIDPPRYIVPQNDCNYIQPVSLAKYIQSSFDENGKHDPKVVIR